MVKVMYIELDIIAFLIIGYIHIKFNSNSERTKCNTWLKYFMTIALIMIVADIISALVEGKDGIFFIGINYLSSMTFLGLTVFGSFYWLLFVRYKLTKDKPFSKKCMILIGIPIGLMTILCVMTPVTHTLFYIDINNIYHRSNWHFLQYTFAFAYLVFASAMALKAAFKEENLAKRREDFVLASFIIFPIIGGVIQILYFGSPMAISGTVIATFIVFVNMQDSQISHDGLTGIFNRRELDMFLYDKIKNSIFKEKLYLLLIDADDFKLINDNFGHVEGDKALKTLSNILKKVCEKENDFVARFGGDEFAIVCTRESEEDILKIKEDIASGLKEINSLERPYKLEASVGYARLNSPNMTTSEFYELADKDLYITKKRRKKIS